MGDAAEELKQHDQVKNDRRLEEPAWRELARLLRPDEQDFDATPDGSNRRDATDPEIFDSTPLVALENFTGGIFGQLINPTNRWLELGLDDEDLAKWRPMKEALFRNTNRLYASLSPAVSGFYDQAPNTLANLGAFGNGPSYQEEQVGQRRILDRAIPVGEIYLATNDAGQINRVHREFVLRGHQIKARWGDRYNCRDDDRKTIVHAVFENPDYRPGLLGEQGMPWRSVYCSPDMKDFRVQGGYYELPYHVAQWNKRTRSAYATGPGHTQKADAQTLQEMERTHLVAGQFAASPPLLLHDESVLTTADIAPDAVLYGGMSDQGKQKAAWLERKGQLQLTMQQSEQRRNAIRAAFYWSIMQLVQRPQMTATEFLGFKEEHLSLMAHNLVRVQTSWLSPFIARRYLLLARAGQMLPLPEEAAGRQITVNYVSPLARVQKMAKGRSILQVHGAIEQLAITDAAVRDKFNCDVAADEIAEAFSEVPGLIRDDRAVAQIREQRAQAQQRAMALQEAAQQAGIAAEVSHAQQAASLARGRGAPS